MAKFTLEEFAEVVHTPPSADTHSVHVVSSLSLTSILAVLSRQGSTKGDTSAPSGMHVLRLWVPLDVGVATL